MAQQTNSTKAEKDGAGQVTEITPQSQDFPSGTGRGAAAELADYTPVKGCMAIRPMAMRSGN